MIKNCIVKSELKRKPDITWILPLLLSEYFFLQIVLLSKLWLTISWIKKHSLCLVYLYFIWNNQNPVLFTQNNFFEFFLTAVWMARLIVIAFLFLEISENSLLHFVPSKHHVVCPLRPLWPPKSISRCLSFKAPQTTIAVWSSPKTH